MCEIPLVCAVTDLGSVDYDVIVILPAAVVSELQNSAVSVMSSAVGTGDENPGTHAIDTNGQESPQAWRF